MAQRGKTLADVNIPVKKSIESCSLKEEMPDDLGGDWYCETCDFYLSPSRVTFQETCDTCGTSVQWLEYLK